jgi:hypothetical protein
LTVAEADAISHLKIEIVNLEEDEHVNEGLHDCQIDDEVVKLTIKYSSHINEIPTARFNCHR